MALAMHFKKFSSVRLKKFLLFVRLLQCDRKKFLLLERLLPGVQKIASHSDIPKVRAQLSAIHMS